MRHTRARSPHCGKVEQQRPTSLPRASASTETDPSGTEADEPSGAAVATELRLGFARRWLDLELGPRDLDFPARTNDRRVFAWSAAAAVRGDPEAQVLLGRCFAAGRGIARNFDQARKWFRRAAASGSTEAQYRLRALRLDRFRWSRHRQPLLGWFGLALLSFDAVTHGVRVDPLGVLAYLGLSVLAFVGFLLVRTASGRGATVRRRFPERDYVFHRHVQAWERRPWRILWVATEDGAFLAPLVWLGITPWSVFLAGALFGLAHYPSFPTRTCVLKGVEYAVMAWLLLPWAGLWSIVVGHVVWDAALLALGARSLTRRSRTRNGASPEPMRPGACTP